MILWQLESSSPEPAVEVREHSSGIMLRIRMNVGLSVALVNMSATISSVPTRSPEACAVSAELEVITLERVLDVL